MGLLAVPFLQADVVVLQSGAVITGQVLQQDSNGVLVQMETGTFRYPPNLIKEVQKEAAAVRHLSNNGEVIPDWAQIVSLLAHNDWADNLQQVPAPVISQGMFKNIPYISFRCATGGYELNIYGDLDKPAAVQFGAMTYNSKSAAARNNCVNFVCSLLASADARKMVRALDLNKKVMTENAGMGVGTILPGEWGSYGGWWVLVYNANALASAQASEAELAAITQSRTAAVQPMPAPAQPAANTDTAAPQPDAATPPPTASPTPTTTTATTGYETYGYGTTPAAAAAWTAAEMNNAHPVAMSPETSAATAANAPHPVTPAQPATAVHPATSAEKVYPRTYSKTPEGYGKAAHHR